MCCHQGVRKPKLTSVGENVGVAVGSSVGAAVGVAVGSLVGDAVGACPKDPRKCQCPIRKLKHRTSTIL
jgi:phage tail tape-measure protein